MMKFLIASPLESKNYEGLKAIFLNAAEGERGILRDHIALVCGLKTGSLVRLVSEAGETQLRVGEGAFLRFRDNEAVLVARSFEELAAV